MANPHDTVPSEPVTTATAPAPKAPASGPAASVTSHDDVYDIGTPDKIDVLAPAGVSPSQAAASEPPPVQSRREDGTFGKAHPRWLVRQAQELGFNEQDIANNDSDQLGEMVAGATKWAADHVRQSLQRQQLDSTSNTPPPQPAAAQPVVTAEEEMDWGLDEAGTRLTEKDYAPSIARFMKQSHEQSKRIKQLEDAIKALSHRQIERDDLDNSDRVDLAMTKHKNALLGDKHWRELDKESPEFLRRVAVFNEAKRQAGPKADFNAILQKVPTVVKTLFGAATPAPSPSPPAPPIQDDSMRRWEEAALARPTSREGAPEPKGKAAAVKAVAERIREQRMSSANGDQITDADEFA